MSDVSMVVAGIDIGKARLDVALHGAAGHTAFDNNASGHRRLIQWLCAAQVVRVGLESTGSYSQEVTGALREAGFEVAVLQPLQVRAFAQYRLRRAKSDPLDAALIATCAALLDKVHEAPDARLVPLADHLRLIEPLEEDVVRAKTRLEAAHLAHARRFLRREVERLERREAAERALLLQEHRRRARSAGPAAADPERRRGWRAHRAQPVAVVARTRSARARADRVPRRAGSLRA